MLNFVTLISKAEFQIFYIFAHLAIQTDLSKSSITTWVGGPFVDASVYTAINLVRQRTSVNLPAIISGTQAELRTIVRRERRVEFSIEEHRLFDIRRWKIAEQVMPGNVYGILNNFNNARADYGSHVLVETRVFNPDRNYVWGYPQGEVDLNKSLVQNSNWQNI